MTDRAALAHRPDNPAPRLSRLDLHGFKSFASRTVFVFEPGITAVVGPNGSGKSNIADAVRWVLGETSYNALRSKKTEDVIFAGGRGKAPAGLAEVTVTFDNEERWLPSEFAEVTVTRRAFRGGENQYFINGRRVRLKDVALLTASLGQSYTVVGQGLVDAALSQRADERRGLFEHAADLTGLRLKVAESERSLNEADGNVARLTDLLNELEPRLKTLERAARQAREWQGLRDRLTFLQRGHYQRLLAAATERLTAAERIIAGDEATLVEARTVLDRLTAERTTGQERIATMRDALASHDARLGAIREHLRRVQHERDLVHERQGALDRRRGDMEDTQTGLDEQVDRVEGELERAAADLATVSTDAERARSEVESLEATARSDRQQRTGLERAAADLTREIDAQERRILDLTQRRALIDQKRETTASERARAQRDIRDREARIADATAEVAAFETEDRAIAGRIDRFTAHLAELATRRRARQETSTAAAEALATAERWLGRATNRFDVLQKVHESGTGLHAGVRQMMLWQRAGKLEGIRGTVAELIAVEATYDTAIEAALGGHVQDVVVDTWEAAEAAIGALKRDRAGRATFQPLDRVGRGGSRPVPREVVAAAGVHGVAAGLVRAEADVAPVVRALLGRMIVVEDLSTARRLVPDLPLGWSAVTLGGEIARSGGSVTGGSAVRESGVLGRERELRGLPAEIVRLEAARTSAESARAAAVEALATTDRERGETDAARAGVLAQQRERAGQRTRMETWLRELGGQLEAARWRIGTADEAAAAHVSGIATVEKALDRETGAIEERRDQHATMLTDVSMRRDEAARGEAALTAARQTLAALDERLRAERRRESSLQAQRRSLADEMSLRAQRVAELDGERTALGGQAERLAREVAALADATATAERERLPLQEAVTASEAATVDLEVRIETARADLLERERGLGQHGLTVERARADLLTIHQRISDDLGYDDPDLLLGEDVAHIPGDDAEPWTLDDDHAIVDREIARLRERLRRVGYVGDDVVDEYERESAHHAFLRTQLADVQAAAVKLRQLLADLRTTMEERFAETFSRVATAFTEAFVTLFGGGTARLILTTAEDDAAGGIDIVAQPPGKRLQSLGLLSGGERSLTAVALLFAILRVNPTPFVLLDEVDAALDEANVVRFRDELRTLAAETQAIVITHNRGTVEIADTLYGVTMGGDGVSQVLSLRLSDLPLDEDVEVGNLAAVSAGVPVW